jgi:hypothetical protein
MSARAELARLVVQLLKEGRSVPSNDAFQLRSWALTPEDAVLSLEDIALGILRQELQAEPGAQI